VHDGIDFTRLLGGDLPATPKECALDLRDDLRLGQGRGNGDRCGIDEFGLAGLDEAGGQQQ